MALPQVAGEFEPHRRSEARFSLLRLWRVSPRATVGGILLLCFLLIAVLAPVLTPGSPQAMLYPPLSPPSWQHLLGTTDQGQGVLAQVLWGARTSLLVVPAP